MKKIKNEMIKAFIFSGIGLFVLLFILYKSVTAFIIQQEVQKARILANTLLYTRQYLATIAPYVEIKDKKFHPFALTPAYAVNQIALLIKKNENTYVKQTSDRYRDPRDKPDKFELQAINYFKTHKNAKEFFRVHKSHKADGLNYEHLFYAYPLKIQRSCLKCHGPVKDVPKPLLHKLEKYYGDKAFGYKLGQLRGIISIKIPFQKIKTEVDMLFLKLALLLFFLYVLGIFLFLKINNLIIKDINKINYYLQTKLAKNIYKPFKEKLFYEEFNYIKKEINYAIKSLKTYKKNLYQSINYNPLTKLPNRRNLLNLLKRRNVPIILLDIDSFKEINYFYGEKVADNLIMITAERLKKFKTYHIKIDQFAVIIENENISKDEIYKFTQNLINLLEKPYEIGDFSIIVKFRAGISFTNKSFLRALSALDATRFLNKDIVFCSEADLLRKEYEKHLLWMKKIKIALEKNKIKPFFQPIVDCKKNICKYEVLVRLIDENGNIITPYYFLDVAKKSRFYLDITKQIINQSFELFQTNSYEFSINLTTMDMENEEMRDFILKKINNFPEPSRINIEIVESEDIKNSQDSFRFIKDVKKLGCKILIDDFGSGYANFDYLLSLGANGIKIDGSLIKNILSDENSQIIVKTIVNFAKGVGMQIVAEFVENDEIFEYLKKLGINCYQGYFYSPPKPEI